MDQLEVGEAITVEAEFVTAGTLTDPTTVTLTLTDPSGTVSTVAQGSLTHTGTGKWAYTFTPSSIGVWIYRFDGTGTVLAGTTGYFAVGTKLHGGPCADWCSIDDIRNLGAYANTTTLPDPAVLRMIPVASKMLYDRTARRFSGVCPATVRPSRRPQGSLLSPWLGPWLSSWQSDWGIGSCWSPGQPFACSCDIPSQVSLGYYPIRQITEVKVDGTVLSPTAYRLDDHRWLTRIDGSGWPSCQDLTADPSLTNTFQVAFLYGAEPGPDGVLAASVLTGELALAASNQTCRLPRRIVSITRQGQTQQLFDPTSLMEKGMFGIPEIDAFVTGVNPNRLQRRASISSPDSRSAVRRTGW